MADSLRSDTLFVALTRPQMFAGVTFSFFVISVIVFFVNARSRERGGRPLFVDLSLSSTEQLSQVVDALRNDPQLTTSNMPRSLAQYLASERAA